MSLADRRLADTHARAEQGVTVDKLDVRPGGVGEATVRLPAGVDPDDGSLDQLIADALGQYVGAASVLHLERLTFGRHPSGGTTVWLKFKHQANPLADPGVRELYEEWVADIRRRRPLKRREARRGLPTDVVSPPADPQLGAGRTEMFAADGHDGALRATEQRAAWFLDEGLPRYCDGLRAEGRTLDTLLVGATGDTGEGCEGSYDDQTYSIVLTRRDQLNAGVALLDAWVQRGIDLGFRRIVLTGCASNHDRLSAGPRKKNVTGDADDLTLAAIDLLAFAYSKNPQRYDGLVEVVQPRDPLVFYYQSGHADLVVAGTHGHQVSGSGAGITKMWNWWNERRSGGESDLARSQVLLAAHHHTPYMRREEGRLLVGLPAMDSGSGWFTDSRGKWSLPAMATLTLDGVYGASDPVFHTSPADRARAIERCGRVA